MKEVEDLLVKTPKTLYGKRGETNVLDNGHNKVFSPEPSMSQSPHEKELSMILSMLEWGQQ
jgi:hypothetical protein